MPEYSQSAVSLLSVLIAGFGIAVMMLKLGYREKADIVRRRLLIKAGLDLCGLMIIVTPLSLYGYWALPVPAPPSWSSG